MRVLERYGFESVRITGGEPTVRSPAPVRRDAQALVSTSMTTTA
jgi:molybdenum cofactor biosynthesis enzyme MoaA